MQAHASGHRNGLGRCGAVVCAPVSGRSSVCLGMSAALFKAPARYPARLDAFLNNNAISPTTQTILVATLAQLGNIPGQAEFIRQAATSRDEHDAIAFQQSVQLMANLNNSTPVARITHLKGLTVCQTNNGTVVVPIQWD
jgi:hypothetical protein